MIEVRGAEQLYALARDCKAAGNKTLLHRMRKGLDRAGAKAKPLVTASAEKSMPTGYGPTLAGAMQVRTSVRTGAETAGVRIIAFAEGNPRRRDVPRLNAGILAHPVWAHRDRWVRQTAGVTAGFFDRAGEQIADGAVEQMQQVLDETARQIARG